MNSTTILRTIINAGANNIIEWGFIIFIIGSIFFEISPIKINPVSALIDYIFKSINTKIDNLQEDVNSKFEDIQAVCDDIKVSEDKYRFATVRWEILSFRNNLTNGNLYSENEYQHIFDDYEEYKSLHEKYDFVNGYIEDAISDIKSHYEENKNLNVKYF